MSPRPPANPKADLDALAADLVSHTARFCAAHLDDEYAALCARLIAKLRRKRVVPFASGRSEIWAASVLHALAQINFAFDRKATPHTSADAIADYFGTSKVTVGMKAKAIRDLLKLRNWDPEFSTAAVGARNPFAGLAMINGFVVPISILQDAAATTEPSLPAGPVPQKSRRGRAPKPALPTLEVHLSAAEYEVLRSIDEPLVDDTPVVQTAGGVVLALTRPSLEDLVGVVAAEANHERSRRRAAVLNEIADTMESVIDRAEGGPPLVAEAPVKPTAAAPTSRGKSARGATEKRACGLCGKTRKLCRTECCGRWICDDEDSYQLFSYARNSCSRNHRRYTVCGLHHAEQHQGDWRTCDACRNYIDKLEIYVGFATNEFNFVKLENPPAFEPTHCGKCGRVIRLSDEGYAIKGAEYLCQRCSR